MKKELTENQKANVEKLNPANHTKGDLSDSKNSLVGCNHGELRKQLELREAELELLESEDNHMSVMCSIIDQIQSCRMLREQLAPNDQANRSEGAKG